MSIATAIQNLVNSKNTLDNVIQGFETTKGNIKSAVNEDFEVINNEQIEQYPSLIRNAIERYKGYIPTVKQEGKELSLNTVPLKPKEFAVIGDTFQQQYEGKNLFNSLNLWEPVRVSNGVPIVAPITNITISNNETTQCIYSKTTTTNATGVKSNFLNLKAGISYIISFSLDVPEDTTVYTNLNTYSNDTYERVVNLGGVTQSGRYEMSYTPVADTQICLISYIGGGYVVNNLKIYDIQLEQGSTATDFEPYVGGTQAPNPEYPQDIQVVTGNQTVVKRGKNLFDKNTNLYKANLTFNASSMKFKTDNNAYRVYYVPCKPNTTYTYSKTLGSFCRVGSCASVPANNVAISVINSSTSANSATITTTANDNYIAFYPVVVSEVSELDNILATIQIEEGSTVTTYEPYNRVELPLNLGNMELCKTEEDKDRLFKNTINSEYYNSELEEGSWYKKNEINKEILDDSLNWVLSTSGGYYRVAHTFPLAKDVGGTRTTDILCTHFYVSTNANYNIAFHYLKQIFFYLPEGMTTVEEFKTLLGKIKPTIYYPLQTPTYTKITDETLINQLEAIEQTNMNEGTTIIYADNEEGLQPTLYVEAYAKVE